MSTTQPDVGTYWFLTFPVPGQARGYFDAALEPLVEGLSWEKVEDETGAEKFWTFKAYSETPLAPEQISGIIAQAAAAAAIPLPAHELTELPVRDWVAENLAEIKPTVAGRFFVYGSHFDSPLPMGKTTLKLDAGAAFGSGEHPTTSGCLLAMDRLAKSRTFASMLDMGCGSGILAMAMSKTWNGSVIAADMDPISVRVTRQNLRINGLSGRVQAMCSAGFAGAEVRKSGPYGLIVANILARPLRQMSRDMALNTEPGGIIILSGLLRRDEKFVGNAYRLQGFRRLFHVDVDDWRTLVFAR